MKSGSKPASGGSFEFNGKEPLGTALGLRHQNPLLPKSISIRRSLGEELAQFIRSLNKEVVIEYC
ncbi:MAG: hypothetical protein ABSE84_12780 [Isosphaeraceae bacterium]|jgi:hypothetical protein